MGGGAVPSEAVIDTVHVGPTTWSPFNDTARTPVFVNGNNNIEVVGSLDLLTAVRFSLHALPCSPSTPGPLIAMGSITARTTQPGTIPKGKLVLSLPLTPTHPVGRYCGQLFFPPPRLHTDPFTVQTYFRGNVQAIQALVNGTPVNSVTCGVEVAVQYNGSFFGRTTSSNLVQTKYRLNTITNTTPASFAATVTFLRSGTVTLLAQDLFDDLAPDGVVSQLPATRYRGGVTLPISVTAGPNGCPATSTSPSRLGTVDTDPTCGGPGQLACQPTGPAVIR